VLQLEDDGSDPKQGTAVAQAGRRQSERRDRPPELRHLHPRLQDLPRRRHPQISPATTQTKYTQQGFKSAFRVVANDAKLGGSLGNYAITKLGAKKIAVIDDRTAYGQGVADEFIKAAKKAAPNAEFTKEFTNDRPPTSTPS
jgi:branched-chain amino acid transport system substrate-binding protein